MANYERLELDPITGLCIITSKTACPVGYRIIDKTYDQQVNADLWKDNFLAKKERYLCVTRFFPLDNGRLNNVIDSIGLINDDKNLPAGFTLVDTTYDTNEKAIKKKFLIVKMVPRHSVQEAVCEIIILNRMRKAPDGYTSFGEIGGFLLCVRKGPIPAENIKALSPSNSGANTYMLQQSDVTGTKATPQASKPNATLKLKSPSVDTQTGLSLARRGSRTLRFNSVSAPLGVDDIPFKLGLKATGLASRRAAPIPNIPIMTLEEIENKFSYDFFLEREFLAELKSSA